MNDFEEIPVESLSGERPRSVLGDRLIVSLAGLALLAGVVIAGAKLLDAVLPDPVAQATSRPSAAPTSQRTPRPTATPRPLGEVLVTPASLEPQPSPGVDWGVSGWLEALQTVEVRYSPSTDAGVVGMLAPGEVSVANQQSSDPAGWVQVQGDTYYGYALLEAPDGTAVARFVGQGTEPRSGSIQALTAGPDQFLALVWEGGQGNVYQAPFLATSTDGASWKRVSVDPHLAEQQLTAAWGPSGWIGVGTSYLSSGLRIWESYDAANWDLLGELRLASQAWVTQVVGSDIGYVMLAADAGRFNGGAPRIWFSADGTLWQESVDPLGRSESEIVESMNRNEWLQVASAGAGFVAWTSTEPGAAPPVRMAFSDDGRRWTEVSVDEPEHATRLSLAQAGTSVVAMSQDPNGEPMAWRLDLAADQPLRLERMPAWDGSLAGGHLGPLTSDGLTAYAFGELRDEQPAQVWTNDGSGWRRRSMPADFVPDNGLLAAARPGKVVVVGAHPTVAGFNPVFWRLDGDGHWRPEANPLVPPVPDPAPDECGGLPATALDFVALPQTWGPACFGDSPMTFTAWSAPCDWCSGDIAPGVPWLLAGRQQLLLAPVSSTDYMGGPLAILDVAIKRDASMSGAWVRVTGHYDDPRATECGDLQSAEAAGYYFGGYWASQQAVEYCRQLFVVTSIEVLGKGKAPPTAAP